MTAKLQASWNTRKQVYEREYGRKIAFVERSGDGHPALLIHGFTDSSRSYSLLEPYLPRWHLLIADLIGHGQSSRPAEGYNLDELAHDVAGVLGERIHPPALVIGHSLGAMTALRLAASYPDQVQAVVLISGSLCPSLDDDPGLAKWIDALEDPIDVADPFFDVWQACSGNLPPDFLASLRTEAAAIPSHVWKSVFATLKRADISTEVQSLKQPVLAIAGGADTLFGARHRDMINTTLRPLRTVVLEHCGHNPHWEAPRQVARLIAEFVNAVII